MYHVDVLVYNVLACTHILSAVYPYYTNEQGVCSELTSRLHEVPQVTCTYKVKQ